MINSIQRNTKYITIIITNLKFLIPESEETIDVVWNCVRSLMVLLIIITIYTRAVSHCFVFYIFVPLTIWCPLLNIPVLVIAPEAHFSLLNCFCMSLGKIAIFANVSRCACILCIIKIVVQKTCAETL